MSTNNPVHACPNCKRPVHNSARFCPACGSSQNGSPEPQQAALEDLEKVD